MAPSFFRPTMTTCLAAATVLMSAPLLLAADVAGQPAVSQLAGGYPADVPLVWPATVIRNSDSQPDESRATPKPAEKKPRAGKPRWKSVTVKAILPRNVNAGDLATVLPLQRSVPAKDLPVKTVQEQTALGAFSGTWAIDMDASVASFLNARAEPGASDSQPFEAVVVYPATHGARLLSRQAGAKDLPAGKGVSPATLWAAVDLTQDGKADVAIFRFCCERPASPSHATGSPPCGSECEATYLRTKTQPWKLVHEASDD